MSGMISPDMKRGMGLVLAATLAGCWERGGGDGDSSAVAGPAAAPMAPLHVEGRYFRDPSGNVVLLRGVNYSHRTKTWPFTSWQRREHFEQLRAWGFNVARYLILWEGIEPEPGVIDTVYLDDVERAVRWASECGVYIFLDMHQDLFARSFGGDGAPAWASVDDLVDPDENWTPWFLNYFTQEVRASFDQLFTNTELQGHYAQAWRAVVERVKDYPNVIGYDLMNEPFPGNTLLPWECEAGPLSALYALVTAEIQAEDPVHPVFVEPLALTANNGLPTAVIKPSENVVYAPHFYDPYLTVTGTFSGWQVGWPWLAFNVHRNVAQSWNTALFIGEFGTIHLGALEEQLGVADRLAVAGWTVWDYNPDLATNEGLEVDFLSIVDENGAERPMLDHLLRPYPALLAGTPVTMNFDYETHEFLLHWNATEGVSRIHIPTRHYPNGITVSGPSEWTYDRGAQVLTVPHGAGQLSLRVRPL